MKILINHIIRIFLCIAILQHTFHVTAQDSSHVSWIRPDKENGQPVWGIKNGIVVGLWPASLEGIQPGLDGGPRGLLRIGYNYLGITYLINFIAVEPLVDGDMEFSEVSPSQADNQWGKFFWAAPDTNESRFSSTANTRGVITHPDIKHPEIEELSLYVFIEKFIDGANPYLKLSLRSDKPEELCLQIFNKPGSATMERCALTATMGNYSRLRLLHLKDTIVDSRKLFVGYNDIEFTEHNPYPYTKMLRTKKGDFIAIAETNETFNELASWPQQPEYQKRWNWRYRPFYKLTQYWRKELAGADSSLQVRVNGRVKYWSGGTEDKRQYIDVPGGPAFENFELRDNYKPGEKFYFGISRKSPRELMDSL